MEKIFCLELNMKTHRWNPKNIFKNCSGVVGNHKYKIVFCI